MNRDQITAWAREATDEPCPYDNGGVTWSFTEPELERFANLVEAAERKHCYDLIEMLIKAEREACARTAEDHAIGIHGHDKHGYAAAIRARGEG